MKTKPTVIEEMAARLTAIELVKTHSYDQLEAARKKHPEVLALQFAAPMKTIDELVKAYN